ncbi:MAG: hypothetical protein GW748_06920 [Alphaproteobacteria bacterium]|nr:hypothetical protein [Alphaproteobacteria bacterium]NCQ67460.1 hypothetical protein [Alphaproteobacteria bacterium]NCT08079.1 hypothetical protein [Alphaproteobacteria bacterium]
MKYDRFLLAIITSVLVADNVNASALARMAAARERNAQKLVEQHQEGKIDEKTAISNAQIFGLGDITEKLTPKDWTEFFLQTAGMDYDALLIAADNLSQDGGAFKDVIAHVIDPINIGVEPLLDWLENWRKAAFGGVLNDTLNHRKKISRMIKAVEAREAFAHLAGHALISEAVFEYMDAHDDVTLKGAYAAHIGAKAHRGVNITDIIVEDVVDNRRAYDVALQRAKVAPEAAYWAGLNRGFSLDEANAIADRVINHGEAEAVALQRVVQAQGRFNALNSLHVAQRVLAGRTLDQAHRDLTVAATKLTLAGRFANVGEDIRNAVSERMYDGGLTENAALRAVLQDLEDTGLKHTNSIPNLADAMLRGVNGTSLEEAALALEKDFVEGTLAIGNLHYLHNNDVLVLLCMGSETIDAGIRTFCASIVGEELAAAFENHLRRHNGLNFIMDNEKTAFYRAHVRGRLDIDYNNLGALKDRIATALAAANTPTAEITLQVVSDALVAENAVAYGGGNAGFGRAVAVKLLGDNQLNLVAATRLVRIDVKAEEIRIAYGHLPLEERMVLATNFIDQGRGNVDGFSMRLALAALPNVNALGVNELLEFQNAVLGGRTLAAALVADIRQQLVADLAYPHITTLNIADDFLAEVPNVLNDSDEHRLLFAKIVHDWPSFGVTFDKKIIGAKQCVQIMVLEGIEADDMEGAYESIMDMGEAEPTLYSEIKAVHQQVRDDGGDVYDMHNFNAALYKLHQEVNFLDHISRPSTSKGISLRFLYTKLKFAQKWNADKNHVEGLHVTRIADLNDQINGINAYDGRAFTIGDQVWDGILGDYRGVSVDLKVEARQCMDAIDLLQHNTRNQPLALNYVNLTYNDSWGQLLMSNFADVSDEDWRNLKTDCEGVIRRTFGGDALEQNRWINGFYDGNYLVGLNPCFGRFGSDRGTREHWKEKIYALYQTAQHQVDGNIVRPGQENYDDLAWKTALDEAKMRLIRGFSETKNGCADGTSSKISILLNTYRDFLGDYTPNLKIAALIAGVVYDWKMEGITKIGEEEHFDAEGSLYKPLLAKQRMRLALSLAGDYQEIEHLYYGSAGDQENSPRQIIRNLFVPGQPIRQGKVDRDGVRRPDVTFEALNVKRLVGMVHKAMQDNIIKTSDIREVVSGDLTLELDERNTVVMLEDGVFSRNVDKEKTKEMALFLLEKFGYVRMADEVKEVFYKGERAIGLDGKISDDVVYEELDDIKYNHRLPGRFNVEPCSLDDLIEAY